MLNAELMLKAVVATVLVATVTAAGQQFPVGTIDFYGLGDLRQQDARRALEVKEGDVVSFEGERPGFIAASERGLAALPGVRAGHVHVVCCEAGKVTVYVGVERKGDQSFVFLPAPKGSVRLPADVVQAGAAFDDAMTAAVGRGDATEDDSQGHALFHDPAARAVQERFVGFAARDLALLRRVLRESSDAGHRALAAQVIAYTARKDDVIDDLARAMRDPSEDVRNNAMRALGVFAAAEPAVRPKRAIPIDGFVGLLNSPVWTDRNKASLALLRLTESRDPALLARLRREALASLVDMARWKSVGHAAPGATILGRMAGLSEEKIAAATETLEGRETIVAAVMAR